ncbi:MAG: hypothetical protein LBQ79_11935 [Deltaproteobacteria bacterium]|jgi:hypothetical protein|nr:hypothetical protein [Deltaproteobacteria bacterium]
MRELPKALPGAELKLAPEIRNRFDRSRKIGCDAFARAGRKDKLGILDRMAGDVESIVGEFRFDPRVCRQPRFGILKRLLRERCSVLPGADVGGRTVTLMDIGADSLQSPCDTGATCSGHEKKGRKVQLAESCGITKKNGLEPGLDFPLRVSVGGARVSDVHAVEPLVSCLEMTGIRTELIPVDNAYNTPNNRRLAGEYVADMVTAVHGGLKDPSRTEEGTAGEAKYTPVDFATSGDGGVTECPRGQKPVSAAMGRRGDACNVHFDRAVCLDCQCRGRHPVKIGKRSACGIRYKLSSLEAARIRAWNGLPENFAMARQRNGAESSISEFKRGVKGGRLRVRGDRREKAVNYIKMSFMNVRRANIFRRACERLGPVA